MSEAVVWSWSVRANEGPNLSGTGGFDVDAYEKASVTLAAGAKQGITVGPGTWQSVSGLLVTASDTSGSLTVAPDGGTAAKFTGPLVLIGTGAVSLLGKGNATLNFDNTAGAAAVAIDLFVTRDATP